MQATLLFAALGLGAPALKEKPADTIVGEWVAVSITVAGKPVATEKPVVRWVFKPDGSRTISRDGELVLSGHFVADPKAKPATVDLDKGPAGGPKYRCIYSIEGDTLTINVGWEKSSRPTEFASRDGCSLYVLKRVKTND
jgi:uncharacterized protein (TIGR03067 family)